MNIYLKTRGMWIEKSLLGIINIDHFKDINDNFGHVYEDEILVLIACIMTIYFTPVNDLVLDMVVKSSWLFLMLTI